MHNVGVIITTVTRATQPAHLYPPATYNYLGIFLGESIPIVPEPGEEATPAHLSIKSCSPKSFHAGSRFFCWAWAIPNAAAVSCQ